MVLSADVHFKALEFVFRDFDQCILRPRVEPVNGRTVDDRREVPDAGPERVADRVEGHDDVQVLADRVDELLPLVALVVLIVGIVAHDLHDGLLLVSRVHFEQVGHFAGVQQTVDALDLRFELDVGVVDQKCGQVPLRACHFHQFDQEFLVVVHFEVPGNDHGFQPLFKHLGR